MKIYQVDAFANRVFSGNPAAVCPLDAWPEDELLHKIAQENNLAETAFYVKKPQHIELRWFTPTVEVDLCGHATLATAFVLFNFENYSEEIIPFYSPRSGDLPVRKNGDLLTLNFPTDQLRQVEVSEALIESFNLRPKEAFKGKTDYMLIFEHENDIRNIIPNLSAVSKLDCRGVIVSAQGIEADFVSRFFGPQTGIDEDPVTGSAHTSLTPYWAEKLGKNQLTAIQCSDRLGHLYCTYLGDRVEISGHGKLYMIGEIFID